MDEVLNPIHLRVRRQFQRAM